VYKDCFEENGKKLNGFANGQWEMFLKAIKQSLGNLKGCRNDAEKYSKAVAYPLSNSEKYRKSIKKRNPKIGLVLAGFGMMENPGDEANHLKEARQNCPVAIGKNAAISLPFP
jgi:hypothetical protein